MARGGLDNTFLESILTTTSTILLYNILYFDKDAVHWVNGAHNGSRFTSNIDQWLRGERWPFVAPLFR